jgi:hypothetical protein
MAKKDYNIIAIDGGSAGLVSAYIGAVVKAKVALIERHQMGADTSEPDRNNLRLDNLNRKPNDTPFEWAYLDVIS